MEKHAKSAYEKFRRHANAPMVPWDALPEKLKHAWIAATEEAIASYARAQ